MHACCFAYILFSNLTCLLYDTCIYCLWLAGIVILLFVLPCFTETKFLAFLYTWPAMERITINLQCKKKKMLVALTFWQLMGKNYRHYDLLLTFFCMYQKYININTEMCKDSITVFCYMVDSENSESVTFLNNTKECCCCC